MFAVRGLFGKRIVVFSDYNMVAFLFAEPKSGKP